MLIIYNFLLFIITFAGGSIPLWAKRLTNVQMHSLLAFSGSFLLSITFLHLIPEAFSFAGTNTGVFLLTGFFLQLIIQRFTHGLEHGHLHTDKHEHTIPLTFIIFGISLHAFMEGLPLGIQFHDHSTLPSLYLAIAAHKLPEAMLLCILILSTQNRKQAFIYLFLFSLITPASSLLTNALSAQYTLVSKLMTVLLPLVAGSFIHIATTIFFESGTQQHALSRKKTVAIILGLGTGLATIIFE